MTRSRLAAAALALALAAAPAAAQQHNPAHHPAPAMSPEEREALGTVQKMFDAMRARDTATLRTLVDTGAKLVQTFTAPDGTPGMRTSPVSQFIASIANAPAGLVLDERIYEPEVRVNAHLATVWVRYDFYAGERLSHCGYDSFQLFRSASGWKIISIADTQHRQGCPLKK